MKKIYSKKLIKPSIFQIDSKYKELICSSSYIGKKGYTIPKSSLNAADLEFLKTDLFMKPQIFSFSGMDTNNAFPIYRENENKIYIPRFYGIERYGLPKKSELEVGDDINIQFVKELRDYQSNIINIYLNHVSNGSNGAILEVPCGRGKCLGKDTPILMYDGSIKPVQDILVGDILMGDDFTGREVLSLARGREQMYKVMEKDTNRFYIVNESHILSLKNIKTNHIIDIEVRDYIQLENNTGNKDYTISDLYGYRIQNNKYPLLYSISIKPLNIDNYYGFEIDGNRRFVLGDYSVTHNTVMALKIISELKKKTLILVHKEFLMNQWIERINEFLPSARVGKIQGSIYEVDGNDIVIGMIQTMYSRDFPSNAFKSFGLTIIDEVHRIGSEEFSKTLLKTITPYMLGISATVERKDGLTRILNMFIGEKIYSEERSDEDPVCVRGIVFNSPDPEFNETIYDWKGNTQFSSMITKICSFGPRSDFIIQILKDLILENPENQIMVLAHNRSLLTYLYEAIHHHQITSCGYYIGGMKESQLKETETKQIVLATYAMAAEALDIKTLSTLVMVTPKTDIEQSVGRILRTKHKNPIVVDLVDKHESFMNQWSKRKTFYRKCNYRILTIDSTKYNGFSNMEQWKVVYEPKNKTNNLQEESVVPTKCLLKLPSGFTNLK
jgi:superfamily II DNA or RNA helicase